MIVFQELELKNFLSIGDNPLVFFLNRSKTTLITGHNGVGKSASVCDGLTFALFGKSFRGVNKAALINTVNQRDSYAKVSFVSKGSSYTILRGQKPARLEITKDGKVLNENAAVSDTQSYIENEVLGFDFATFIRVCILSTMNYIPFMQLSAYERRNFVENMLSLKAFTDMNKIHKSNVAAMKDKITIIEREMQVAKTAYKEKHNTLQLLEQIDEDRAKMLKDEVDRLIGVFSEHCDKITDLKTKISEMESMKGDDKIALLKVQISNKQKQIRELEVEMSMGKKRIESLTSTSVCASCMQPIGKDHVHKVTSQIESDIKQKEENVLQILQVELSELESDLRVMRDHEHTLSKLKSNLEYTITSKKIVADDLKKKVAKLENQKDDSGAVRIKEELAVIKAELKKHVKKFDELQQKLQTGVIVTDLLKDTGIKGAIIKQYVPLLVGYVNHYLEKLNISIKFSMDENFNESITTRYANEYTYGNLSAGERARIDLAIAFAWRQVARLKGSVHCNVLVLDEVADASLDVNGTEDLMTILEDVTADTNVFIVSHKSNLDEHVRSVLRLEKHNGFTRIVG